MFCDYNDDIEKFDLNIDERIVVVHSSSNKDYQGYGKMVMCLLMSLEEFRSYKERSFSEMEGLLQNQIDVLNSEHAEKHSLHESINLKEVSKKVSFFGCLDNSYFLGH